MMPIKAAIGPILIDIPKRLEIAVTHTKQNIEVISNRNKITTSTEADSKVRHDEIRSCNPSNPVPQFDGSYRIDKLPVGANYKVYVEPLDGLATSEDFYETSSGICNPSGTVACTAPAVNTNFTTRVQPAAQ
jgi:hypothetical protein